MMRFIALFSFCFLASQSNAQTQKPKFFIEGGSGLGFTVFGRGYDEVLPSSTLGYRAFLNKNLIGTTQEYVIGVSLKANWSGKVGYNRQRYTRKVEFEQNVNGAETDFNHRIQHIDNSVFIAANKHYPRKKGNWFWGVGAGYIISQAQILEIYPNTIINREDALEDLIALGEFGYTYNFQNKVGVGVKGQAWWILSGSYFNSFSFLPFVTLKF